MPRHKDAERSQIANETRQKLLDAAAEAFASEGYVGANVNSISKAAGFAKGTIYNYFESKQALMLALIDEIAALHLAVVAGRVRDESDLISRLQCFFEAGFQFVTDNLPQAKVMVGNLFGPHDAFKSTMFAAYQPMFGLVAQEIIQPGIEQGVFRAVDPVETATLLMTIYLGTASQVNEQGVPWMDAGQVANFALHALRPGDGAA